jgi:ABC-type polysaccharide/polyol phosphate export permease
MVDSLYPHQSPLIQLIAGLACCATSSALLVGRGLGWFTIHPATYGNWCATYNIISSPSIFGIDPYFIAAAFLVLGIGFGLMTISTNFGDIKENSGVYCPHCKRKIL